MYFDLTMLYEEATDYFCRKSYDDDFNLIHQNLRFYFKRRLGVYPYVLMQSSQEYVFKM